MLYDFYLLLQNPRTRTIALPLWGLWTLATAAGWGLAGFAGLPVGRVMVAEGSVGVIFSVAFNMGLLGALIGALIGVFQWLFLRRRIPLAGWWILATALGWGVGLPAALLINLLAGVGLSAFLYGVVVGGMVGAAQWVLLKRFTTPAGRWVWASVVAFPVGISVSGLVEQVGWFAAAILWDRLHWWMAISGGAAGIVVGMWTGITLLALFWHMKRG